jgi:hypothetical protein
MNGSEWFAIEIPSNNLQTINKNSEIVFGTDRDCARIFLS